MSTMFPPINSGRPESDIGGGENNGSYSPSASKLRRQIAFTNNDRSPLRSKTISTSKQFAVAASHGASGITAESKNATNGSQGSASIQKRSPSFAQNSPQFEPNKIVYRASDYSWNENGHTSSNNLIRASSPTKTKLSSAKNLTNGILHENNGVASSLLHIPSNSNTGDNRRTDINGDIVLSASKSRQTRINKTNNQNMNFVPVRSESYRSGDYNRVSRLEYPNVSSVLSAAARPRNTSSKQRNYVNSKSSFHDEYYDMNGGANNENNNIGASTQQLARLSGSSFDLTANRKPLSPNKSSTFNLGLNHYYSSTNELRLQEQLHRSETNIDKTKYLRLKDSNAQQTTSTTLAVPLTAASKFRAPTNINTRENERIQSAVSYKSRDPNVSYAYTDVKKYIEENDLMPPEKEQVIRNWIQDVEKHRNKMEKMDN
ncbi:unnamed protein product [Didymodactylos carnosus]|nr:unnamed protein product [Didymodactylos carnosus]CAF4161671.1 unnamed protein product [Didymodactylos carnosus]